MKNERFWEDVFFAAVVLASFLLAVLFVNQIGGMEEAKKGSSMNGGECWCECEDRE